MTSRASEATLPRPHLGAARRLRILVLVLSYAAIAVGILLTTGTLDRIEGFRGLHLLPLLLAVAASLIFAPPAGEGATRRDLLASLGLAGGVGVIVALIVAIAPSRPWWLGKDLYYADLMLSLRRGSVLSVLVAGASCAAVPLPLLVVRRKSGELEWQVLGGMVSGLAAILLTATDAVLEARVGVFGALIPFGVLGAGSFVADRWIGRGRPLGKSAAKPLLKLLAMTALGTLAIGPAFQGVTGTVLRGALPLRTNLELESALVDLQESLNERHAKVGGPYPSSLGEHPGVEPEFAAGLKLGYVIRYGRTKDGWSLAADPVEHPGQGWACYFLAHDGELESNVRAFQLTH